MKQSTLRMETKEEKLNRALLKESNSLFGFFIKKYRITYLIILFIVLFGMYSLFSLPREASPEVKIPFAVVTTFYPGSTPTDVEELITNKIEDKISNLDNLKRYTSTSRGGLSSIFIEFSAEADLKDSIQKLKDVVEQAKASLPNEAKTPQVTELRISDMPIVTYSLVDEASLTVLKNYADIIKDAIEGINQVSKVVIVGGLEREIQIIVNQTKLANFKLSLSQVVFAIQKTNFNLPAGNIENDGLNYNVRIQGKFEEINDLTNIVIANSKGIPIYLRDIATIVDTHKEQESESRIGFSNTISQNTISLHVYKKTGGNIINIIEQADKAIAKLQKGNPFLQNIQIEKTNDNSWFIKDSLNRLGISGLQTMALIVVLLLLVLGFKESLITGLSVPLAFLMAFIFLNINGESLNSIVLYSLIISLGLMVDNSIIIMEGINEYRTKYQKSPIEASLLSVWNFKWAIISGTMTTVAAFLPMLLVSGILGEFLSFIPITISATLISSLFVALIIIPTLSSRFTKKSIKEKTYGFSCNIVSKIATKYRRMMKNILENKKKRRLIIGLSWLCFIIAILIPASGLMKVEMFSSTDFDSFLVNIKLPSGSSIDTTKQVVLEVEEIIAQIPELKSYVTTIGSGMSFTSFEGGSSGSHLANISINLITSKERKKKSFEIAEELRPKLKNIKGARANLEEAQAGPPSGAVIEIRIFGKDLQELIAFAKETEEVLENIPDTLNVKDSIEESTFDFTFKINKQKANYYGLDVVSVASTIRNALYGVKSSSLTLDNEDIDITVKYASSSFNNIDDLKNLLIATMTGDNIPLREISTLSLEPSLLNISHRDGEKIVSISSDITKQGNIKKILSSFDEKKPPLPNGIKMEIGGEVEDIAQSYKEMFLSMILAVILIGFILVLQFNSFKQPLIILFSLPLAIIGVIIGLNILRMPFSFPVFLGIVSLAGIAVNDAIVLIDRVNKNTKYGMPQIEALVEAGSARMQPIFLTSLTTIFGVLPLVFADELWRGFSVTLIFGLISSTVLTLVIIPILYNALNKTDKITP